MIEPDPTSDANNTRPHTPVDDRAPPMPRWVRVFGVVAILLVATFIVVHLAGGGFHGHMPR